MFIPIGVDCGIASFLKKHNIRTISFPFDWCVSYNGVSSCIDNDFDNFIPSTSTRINAYDIYFNHDFTANTYNDDIIKYDRRVKRLQNILESSEEEIIFCRKGHASHNHGEHNGKFVKIKNDIDDAEDLDRILSRKYPNLKYSIIVILICGDCFNPETVYSSSSDNIVIHNISMPSVNDTLVDNCATKIFGKFL